MSTLPALRPICRPMTRSIFDAGKKSAERIISDLFSAGQQGFWLPFTDFASLSQDAAGTLPYTALEQPVGRVLDRSGRGNHASQVTSTARGVVSARVNLLQSTESLLGVVWGRFAMQGDATLAVPTVTNTQHYVQQSIAMVANTGYVISMEASAQGYRYLRVGPANSGNNFDVCFDLQTGTIALEKAGGSSTITPLTGGRFLLRIPFIATLTQNATVAISVNNAASLTTLSFSGDGVSGIEITKTTCVPVAQASLPYQRVNTPTDYDAIGFPKYLRLDGTDDSYTCGGGGSTTGFYYSDVITNLKPPGSNMVLFSDQVGNSGYEIVLNSTNGLISFKVGNGSIIGSLSSDVALIFGVSAHVACFFDGTNATTTINGVAKTVVLAPSAAGASTITLYRGASTNYFNGQTTEPIYRAGPPPNAYEREVIRNYQMQKAGML